MINGRTILVAALVACLAPRALADDGDYVSPAWDQARPAVGEWIGHVSWNEPIVSYGWTINANGTFSSGRVGRGESGGGAWSLRGTHLTLKYGDRFRYEGELLGNLYAGTAYAADGRSFGSFSMSRAIKTQGSADNDGG